MRHFRKQRGDIIGTIIVYGLIAAAIVGALWWANSAWNGYKDGLREEGRADGVSKTEAKYTQRDNDALQAALAEVEKLKKEAKQRAQVAKGKVDVLSGKLEEEKRNVAEAENRILASVADGSVVLRGTGKQGTSCGPAPSNRGPARSVAGNPSDLRGAGGGELFDPADAAFLVSEASRADKYAKELISARNLLRIYRESCAPS